MGQRSAGRTLAAIYVAFTRKNTWTQAELAREIGVASKTLGKRLAELEQLGMGVEKDPEPPHVYWSVPKGWLPGAVALESREVAEALRLLSRLPKTARRDKLLTMLARVVPGETRPPAQRGDQGELDDALATLEDAARARTALRFRYASASSGADRVRLVSVLELAYGPRPRFVGFCHERGELRWFRVDRVRGARLAPEEAFRGVDPEALERFVAGSVDGFQRGAETLCAFTVRGLPWVQHNLPVPMRVEPVASGLRFSATTAGVEVLARFVVGLGDAARDLTPELAARVKQLALGALRRTKVPKDQAARLRTRR